MTNKSAVLLLFGLANLFASVAGGAILAFGMRDLEVMKQAPEVLLKTGHWLALALGSLLGFLLLKRLLKTQGANPSAKHRITVWLTGGTAVLDAGLIGVAMTVRDSVVGSVVFFLLISLRFAAWSTSRMFRGRLAAAYQRNATVELFAYTGLVLGALPFVKLLGLEGILLLDLGLQVIAALLDRAAVTRPDPEAAERPAPPPPAPYPYGGLVATVIALVVGTQMTLFVLHGTLAAGLTKDYLVIAVYIGGMVGAATCHYSDLSISLTPLPRVQTPSGRSISLVLIAALALVSMLAVIHDAMPLPPIGIAASTFFTTIVVSPVFNYITKYGGATAGPRTLKAYGYMFLGSLVLLLAMAVVVQVAGHPNIVLTVAASASLVVAGFATRWQPLAPVEVVR